MVPGPLSLPYAYLSLVERLSLCGSRLIRATENTALATSAPGSHIYTCVFVRWATLGLPSRSTHCDCFPFASLLASITPRTYALARRSRVLYENTCCVVESDAAARLVCGEWSPVATAGANSTMQGLRPQISNHPSPISEANGVHAAGDPPQTGPAVSWCPP